MPVIAKTAFGASTRKSRIPCRSSHSVTANGPPTRRIKASAEVLSLRVIMTPAALRGGQAAHLRVDQAEKACHAPPYHLPGPGAGGW